MRRIPSSRAAAQRARARDTGRVAIPLTTTVLHRVEIAGDTGITATPIVLERGGDSLCTYLRCHLPIA